MSDIENSEEVKRLSRLLGSRVEGIRVEDERLTITLDNGVMEIYGDDFELYFEVDEPNG